MSETDEFFSTPESEARLDLIRHLIENSELVPLVRGVSGIGKSLLASRLQTTAPKGWVVCHFSADSMLQPERLLAHIARCNGLPDAKDDNIRRLVDRFETLRKRGMVPVLLIDDAQKLPPTSLITLLRLYERQVGGAPLVSLVLFANEQIDMLLSTPQLQIMSPQSIQVIDLPPLTREEADAYMRYLLKSEGLASQLALDAGRMSRIYRETGGAPGPMGVKILEAFGEGGGSEGVSPLSERRAFIWGGVPLVALVVLVLVFQGPINDLFSSAPGGGEKAITETDRVQIEPLPVPAKHSPSPIQTPAVSDTHAMPASLPTTAQETAESPDMAVDKARDSGASTIASAEPESSPPLPVEEAETAMLATDESSSPAVTEVVSAIAPAPDKADTEVKVAKESDHPLTVETVQPEPAVKPTQTSEKPVKTIPSKSEPKRKAAASSLLRSGEWLAARPSGAYTIQLLAAENIESVRTAVKNQGLSGEVFTVRTERKGKPWYPLLWGEYPNRDAAVEAIKRLPESMQAAGAWARSFASLQQ